MRIVIFGVGNFYQENKDKISSEDNIIAFLDNNRLAQGKKIDGIEVCDPSEINLLKYDAIIIMSIYFPEIKAQLLKVGVLENKIWTLDKYKAEKQKGILKLFYYADMPKCYKRRVLVLTTNLNYNGGTIAAVYAAKALQLKEYQVLLAAPSGNDVFIEEILGQGINVVLCPSIRYISRNEMQWIAQFDVVIVNVFQMLPAACEISRFRPVLWWLHENSTLYCNIYESVRREFSKYDSVQCMECVNVAAVSNIAKRNFEVYYPQRVNRILPYGIPDEHKGCLDKAVSEKITFALIGEICERKNQKGFIRAALNFTREEMDKIEFLLIGDDKSKSVYSEEVKKLAASIPKIKLLGQQTRLEMKDIYHKIDVVVCASLEETMSIVITEGMMHGKLCVTTDATGIADYITDKENGFICKAGNVNSLYETMRWITENEDKLKPIRENARKTYEKYFTLERFGERLEKLLQETEGKYMHNGKD